MSSEEPRVEQSSSLSRLRPWFYLLLSGLFVRAFWDVGVRHGGYRLPYGHGASNVPGTEIALYLWYLVFGLLAALLLWRAVDATSLARRLEALLAVLGRRPRWALALAAGLLLAGAWLFRSLVLVGSPVADDESTYVFIARTLLQGRVVNPLPGDEAFFHNQFVVLSQAGWFGKYPLGHPALLALGEAVGLRVLVVPLLSAVGLPLTFLLGRRLFGERVALASALLLLLSPQYLFTAATELSQPSSTFLMLLGALATLRLVEAPSLLRGLLAGAAWGAAILVRPLPGVLFTAAAALAFLLQMAPLWRQNSRALLLAMLGVALMLLLAAGLLVSVNGQQTGSSLLSGYHASSGDKRVMMHLFSNVDGAVASSFGGALLRQSFWLWGWCLSLLFVAFARPGAQRAGSWLFWGLIVAEYSYRLLYPKTVVATTGPVYVAEIVPLLAMGTVHGMVRVARWLRARGVARAKEGVLSLAVAMSLIALTTFIPLQLREIHRSGEAWQTVYGMLEARSVRRALVFINEMVPSASGLSWAYNPPNPRPALDDAILMLRIGEGPQGAQKMREIWQRRFADRPAFLFYYRGAEPRLVPIHAKGARPRHE